jgi:hypothetical protein
MEKKNVPTNDLLSPRQIQSYSFCSFDRGHIYGLGFKKNKCWSGSN